jgi:hypothetical protein
MDGTQWGFNSSFVGFSNPIFVNQFVQGYNVAKKVMNLVIHLYKLLKLKMVKITFCQFLGLWKMTILLTPSGFIKPKLYNHFTMHLDLIVCMFSQQSFTLKSFPLCTSYTCMEEL